MSELKPTPNKLSLTNKSLISLGTMAIINISYTGIINQNKTLDSNQTKVVASSLVEDATDDINAALNHSYPLWKACNFEARPQSEWGKEMEECGKELRWTQEEIDYENRMNSEAFAMLFLFFLDIVPTRPSVASLESAASRISKTPKQSATFKSATGERITLRTKSTSAGETLEARVTKRNGQTTTKNEPINRSKNNKPSNKSPREIEGVPCISSVIPNTPNNLLLANSNFSNSNSIDQFIQRLRTKYNLVREGQMPIDVAMGLMDVAEARPSCGTRFNGKEISKAEKTEVIRRGGTFKLEDVDIQGGITKIRQDFLESSFELAETRLQNNLGVDLRKLNWDAEVGSVETVNGAEFTRMVEEPVGGYLDPNGRTFTFKLPNGRIGRISWHNAGHRGFLEQFGDFNAEQAHFNLELRAFQKLPKIESHIVYPKI